MSALDTERIRVAACGCHYDIVTELTVAHCRRHTRRERYCEACGGVVGTMTAAAWEACGRACDRCEGAYEATDGFDHEMDGRIDLERGK